MGTNGCLAHKKKNKRILLEILTIMVTLSSSIFQQLNGGHYNVHTDKPRIYNCLLRETDQFIPPYQDYSIRKFETKKNEAIFSMYSLTEN